MIILDRKTGQIVHMDKPTPEQTLRLHEVMLRDYIKRHPETLGGKIPGKA